MRDNPEAVLRDGARIAKNLWAADPTLWTEDQTTQRFISNRLGWLTASDWLRIHLPELQDRVDRVLALNWQRVVLLGMGGSSLTPTVLCRTFGVQASGLALEVLDTSHPEAVRRVAEESDPAQTLFLVSSKSGTTVEVMALLAYFDDLKIYGDICVSI